MFPSESAGCSKSGGFSSLKENWPRTSMAKKRPSVPPTDHVTVLPSGSLAEYDALKPSSFSETVSWARPMTVGGSFTLVTLMVTPMVSVPPLPSSAITVTE